ncbi:MAG: hypothetical protein P8O75_05075 [Gammaproteobacteria bacterium]|jgi:hypothetical protein|nr:hypothetical protein [Gammaproteobacteria bacterium]
MQAVNGALEMEIDELMYFGGKDSSQAYCLATTESGQVYYSLADENSEPVGEWKLVNLDIRAMSQLH